jgi:hypothetical protein
MLWQAKMHCKFSHAGGLTEKRKAKLRMVAKKRRHEAIQRAAPKALNPYGSDESEVEDDAAPGAPPLSATV